MRKMLVATLSMAAIVLGGVALSPAAGAQEAECQTIVEIAAANPDFSTLVTAVTEAGLVETLNGDGPVTVRIGHRLDNRSTEPARYLVIGTRRTTDRIQYTDHDLITEKDGPLRRYLHRDGTPYGDAK